MDGPLTPLEELGRLAAKGSDEQADPAALERARTRALAGFNERRRGGARAKLRTKGALALIGAGLCALTLAMLRPDRGRSLTYTVGEERAPHPIGAWIAAIDREVPLRFSEGSVMTLAAEARARVTNADEDGAEVLLERGSVRANVMHRSEATKWALRAGPFEVRVVGTELAVAWDPARDEIDVRMIEGRVVVTGPLLEGGRALSSGQRLRVAVREQRLDITVAAADPGPAEATARGQAEAAPPSAEPSGAPIAEALQEAPQTDAKRAEAAAPSGPARESGGLAPTWRELAAGGKHRDAMQAVDREGFASVLERASGPELVTLADAARFAGDFGRARAALLRARERGQRGRPAFLLGKLAADHLGAAGDAISWFQTYLAEEPGGGLAEQALGRIVELRKRIGDTAGAQAAAKTYLSKYPGGAYASLAKLALEP